MTPTLLREAGELLYGPRWQSELAESIGVSNRTIRRWVSGEWPVAEGAWSDILDIVRERRSELKDWLSCHDPQHRRENK